MSQENVEVVRNYFETVNEGDFAQAMRYYADDVELVVSAKLFLEAGTFRGKASGADVGSTIAYLFRIGDGQIAKLEVFPDRRSALEAVGKPRLKASDRVLPENL